MKRLLVVLAFAVVAGCAGMSGLTDSLHGTPAPANESSQQMALREAHNAIDEANAGLISLNKVIKSNVESGVWAKAVAQDYLDRSKYYGSELDKARALVAIGDLSSAKSQAELISQFILTLHKKIAAKAQG